MQSFCPRASVRIALSEHRYKKERKAKYILQKSGGAMIQEKHNAFLSRMNFDYEIKGEI